MQINEDCVYTTSFPRPNEERKSKLPERTRKYSEHHAVIYIVTKQIILILRSFYWYAYITRIAPPGLHFKQEMLRTWTVIGGGPCGLASVARLLDLNFRVNWIDPKFECGRMGQYYKNVPANTTNKDLLVAMNLCKSLEFNKHQDLKENSLGDVMMRNLEPMKCYDLGVLVNVLDDSTSEILPRVTQIQGYATKLTKSLENNEWTVETERISHGTVVTKSVKSDAVIYVCGGVPIRLKDNQEAFKQQSNNFSENFESGSMYDHSMDLLVDPVYCNQLIASLGVDQVWAVVGE